MSARAEDRVKCFCACVPAAEDAGRPERTGVESADWLMLEWRDAPLAQAGAWLDETERARLEALRAEADQRLYLAAHGLLRQVLGELGPVGPAEWRFRADERGRPQISFPVRTGLTFSLTHTGGLVAVAVGRDVEVGVDAEWLGRRQIARLDADLMALAERYFAPTEQAAVAAKGVAQRPEAFLRFWTLKEAYLKARGVGLTLPLRDFAFELADEGRISLRAGPELEPAPGEWHFAQFWPTEAHCLAVAARFGR